MSFFDWDGDGKITMADDMIDFMVYEDVMREKESEPLFPKRIKSVQPHKAPKPPKTDPAPKAEPEKTPLTSVNLDWPENPDKDEINEAIKKSDRKDHRKKVIKRIVVWAVLFVIAFCFVDYKLGKRQMEKGIEVLWEDEGELEAIEHFRKTGLLIKQPGAKDMIYFCYAQYAYVYEKDYIKAMMYAREINEDTLIRIDITAATAYELLTDGLSKHFKGVEDYSTGLPYVGMPEDDVDLTCLGKSDWRVGWHTIEVNGRKVQARAHDYYNKHKQYIFSVWCAGNKVIAIEDHTGEPLDQNPYVPETPKPTYKVTPKSTPAPTGGWYDPGKMTYDFYGDDPYDASNYSNPDDFYDDHYDDFYDYDEAEEYWLEHEYD